MRGAQGDDVEALGVGIPQEPQIQWIPGARGEIAVVGQDHGGERPRGVDDVDAADVHPVLGERARLVGGDDVHRAKRLDGRQAPHDGALPRHPLDTEREGHREHGGQAFGDGGHRQRDGEDDDVRRPAEAFGRHTQHPEHEGEPEHHARDLTAEGVDTLLERRLRRLDVAEHRRQAPHRTRGPGTGDVHERMSAEEQRAAEGLVRPALVHRERLPRQDGFVQHGAVGLGDDAIGRHAIARLDADAVAGHDRLHGDPLQAAVTQDPGLRPREHLESGERRLGAVLLIQTEGRIEQQDDADGRRLDRPAPGPLVDPHPGVEDQGEEQDVDQGTRELGQQAAPHGHGRPFGQRVGANPVQQCRRLGDGESRHLSRERRGPGRWHAAPPAGCSSRTASVRCRRGPGCP